jgi:predicted ribosomally synthesized peptide with nif11-like leader
MSVKAAMEFIQLVRADESLRRELEALGRAADLECVIRIAQSAGYTFSVEELRVAFKHDWAMRWIRFGGADAQATRPPDEP